MTQKYPVLDIKPETTTQEVFDAVAKHLLTQNSRSVRDSSYTCLYRNDQGLACAVGCLLTDEEASLLDSGGGTLMLVLSLSGCIQKGIAPIRLNPHEFFLSELQAIHDHADPPDWLARLHFLAQRQGLNTNVLPAL